MIDPAESFRRRALIRAERWLHARTSPRLLMFLIVLTTGACAFLFSVVMLRLGLTSMALRYPLAIVLSYAVFLGLLRLWLSCQEPDETASYDGTGGVDMAPDILNLATNVAEDGASAGGSSADVLSAIDAGEVWLAAIVAVAVAAGVFLCAYVVSTAPALFAELLVDGLIMSRIYARLKVTDRSSWLPGVFRRTWLPALLTALFFSLAGFAMQMLAPGAVSLWEAVAALARR
jgi:hypothetical protein